MSDRVFFSLAALAAVLMIALAVVWPQGLGRRSPGVFGRRPGVGAAGPPVLRPLAPSPTPPPVARPAPSRP